MKKRLKEFLFQAKCQEMCAENMIIKHMPQDFIVNEIYDEKDLRKNPPETKSYFYFKLTKTNYAQLQAIRKVASVFNVGHRSVHFLGTKDKMGITTQLISIANIEETKIPLHIEFLNSNIDDLHLEYIGKFTSRLNLGNNKGNEFKIIIRDVNETELEKFNKNLAIFEKGNWKIKNFFETQRFGFANNTHIIGKFLLAGEIKLAVFEILKSCPQNPQEEIKIFTDNICENFNQFIEDTSLIDKAIELCPKYFSRDYLPILNHLKKCPNDNYGAFRTLPKTLRTLYVHAYQSYIFNETLKKFPLTEIDSLPLLNFFVKYDEKQEKFIDKILKKDNLTKSSFELTSMPELRYTAQVNRNIFIKIEDFKTIEIEKDDLFKNAKKIEITFKLKSGAYATNFINQLFI